jgi:hypothetical protein
MEKIFLGKECVCNLDTLNPFHHAWHASPVDRGACRAIPLRSTRPMKKQVNFMIVALLGP